jgi:hypothetical protein
MIIELISFSIGSLYGLSIASLTLTLIDRNFQKQQQRQKKNNKETLHRNA